VLGGSQYTTALYRDTAQTGVGWFTVHHSTLPRHSSDWCWVVHNTRHDSVVYCGDMEVKSH